MNKSLTYPTLLTLIAAALPAAAQSPTDAPEAAGFQRIAGEADILVFARGEEKIGVAHAASEGSVGGSDLLVRPLLRVAELLEAVPGMIAAQHSGSGKANQYFLRGFNLDHGSDFSTAIDGVPINLRSHGHGQGYLDLNGLIPEVVAREDFRKGPYRASGGDFSLAGSAAISTIDSIAQPWVAAEAGSYGARRVGAGGTIRTGDAGSLTLVGQAKSYDGPWQLAERLRHYAGFAKYATNLGGRDLAVSLHGYRGTWRPTEQIPERIIGSSACADIFCSPDPSARGETTRFIANVALQGSAARANIYGQYYDWSMSSNPTFADADGTSAQILQFDRRWVFGGSAQRTWRPAAKLALTAGTELRFDDIGDVGVYRTTQRAFLFSLGRYGVREGSAALFAEAVWEPLDGLRAIGGLRGDYYGYSVRARDEAAAALGEGRGNDALLSPKLSLAYRATPALELYGNWGRGFHSNDVRGAVNREARVPVLSRGTGAEAGVRWQQGGLSLTATYWWLDLASELRFVGDSNSVEPAGASHRRGYELVGFWRPADWLALDFNYTASRSRFDNGDRIPNAFESAASIGLAIVSDRWEGSLRLRHLGAYPLTEDNRVRDKGSTVVNMRAARRLGRVQIYGEVLNMLDSRDKDIAYFYESFVPGADQMPVEGRLSRVVEPRTVRIGAKLAF